jgi:hypothetical protein
VEAAVGAAVVGAGTALGGGVVTGAAAVPPQAADEMASNPSVMTTTRLRLCVDWIRAWRIQGPPITGSSWDRVGSEKGRFRWVSVR